LGGFEMRGEIKSKERRGLKRGREEELD